MKTWNKSLMLRRHQRMSIAENEKLEIFQNFPIHSIVEIKT